MSVCGVCVCVGVSLSFSLFSSPSTVLLFWWGWKAIACITVNAWRTTHQQQSSAAPYRPSPFLKSREHTSFINKEILRSTQTPFIMMDNDDALLNNGGPQSGAETVYGTEDNNMVMSEKVIVHPQKPSFILSHWEVTRSLGMGIVLSFNSSPLIVYSQENSLWYHWLIYTIHWIIRAFLILP